MPVRAIYSWRGTKSHLVTAPRVHGPARVPLERLGGGEGPFPLLAPHHPPLVAACTRARAGVWLWGRAGGPSTRNVAAFVGLR